MGGAEVFTHEVCSRLVKLGHKVTLFTSRYPGSKNEEIVDGVQIVRAGGKYTVYLQAKRYYKKRFSKENFDVVIDEINTVPFFAHKFTRNNEKVVALIHQTAKEYWFYETPLVVSFFGYHFFEKRWLKQYVNTPTVTVSNSTKQDLLRYGFKKVFIVHEGLNFEPLKEPSSKTRQSVIVYAGRLKRAKRPDHAVEAFKIVKKSIPEVELWLIGDGDFKSKLEKIGGEGVRFLGYLSSEERRKRIMESWVLVNPSVREGWGLNVVEAAALGVPTVAYNVAGLRDSVQDGKTGLLVVDGSIEALAEGLIRVIKDNAFKLELSKNALEYADGFSWDNPVTELLKILEEEFNE